MKAIGFLAITLVVIAASLAFSDAHPPATQPATTQPTATQPGVMGDQQYFVLPVGPLGSPVGTYLRIEGQHGKELGGLGGPPFMIDTVNGKKLAEPVTIWVENANIPLGVRCILKGYETCDLIGVPPAIVEAAREVGKKVEPSQFVWHLSFAFVVLSAVEPNDLKINKIRGKFGQWTPD